MNESLNIPSEPLVKGNVYKVYSKEYGALMYSAARYDGIEKNQEKFTCINMPNNDGVWMSKEDLSKYVFVKTVYNKNEKKKRK